MSARVDTGATTVVVWCTECSSWSEVAADTLAGHDAAVRHEERVHPRSRVAEINRFKFRRRRAM